MVQSRDEIIRERAKKRIVELEKEIERLKNENPEKNAEKIAELENELNVQYELAYGKD